jgi:hypothetical protein
MAGRRIIHKTPAVVVRITPIRLIAFRERSATGASKFFKPILFEYATTAVTAAALP